MSDRVAIVGVAQTKFSPKRVDVNAAELAYEAIEEVMEACSLNMAKDIDNAVSCSQDAWDGRSISNLNITDVAGGHLRCEEKVAMDGALAVYYGAVGILSGEFECTLVLAHTKMSEAKRNIVNNIAFEPIYSRLLGLDFTSAGALQAKRYMDKYGITEAQTAQVVVKNLKNAMGNPKAHHKGNYTIKDVLDSPLVAAPMRQMDIAPDTDGAVAIIMASEERAAGITGHPVWVKGMGTCYDAYYLGDRDLADCMALERASAQAYKMANISDPRKEIDVIELSEEFSYQELLWLEGLGICERGRAGMLLDSGETSLGGKLPVNPSGGVLSGVPINVMGLNRVAEAALQLVEKAEGHQVQGAKSAICQGHSGFCGQHHCVIVLGKD